VLSAWPSGRASSTLQDIISTRLIDQSFAFDWSLFRILFGQCPM
jgi:hypothetical protein